MDNIMILVRQGFELAKENDDLNLHLIYREETSLYNIDMISFEFYYKNNKSFKISYSIEEIENVKSIEFLRLRFINYVTEFMRKCDMEG